MRRRVVAVVLIVFFGVGPLVLERPAEATVPVVDYVAFGQRILELIQMHLELDNMIRQLITMLENLDELDEIPWREHFQSFLSHLESQAGKMRKYRDGHQALSWAFMDPTLEADGVFPGWREAFPVYPKIAISEGGLFAFENPLEERIYALRRLHGLPRVALDAAMGSMDEIAKAQGHLEMLVDASMGASGAEQNAEAQMAWLERISDSILGLREQVAVLTSVQASAFGHEMEETVRLTNRSARVVEELLDRIDDAFGDAGVSLRGGEFVRSPLPSWYDQ